MTAETHDYATAELLASYLNSTHILVGESGGLSAVYDTEPSNAMPGCLRIETEHGTLYADPDEVFRVLAEGGN